MEKAISTEEKIQNERKLARKDGVLFDSRWYEINKDDYDDHSEAVALEERDYKQLMNHFGFIYTESALIGKVGLLDGDHRGYKFCHKFNDLENFLARFPHIVVRQKGARIFFTLIGYSEKHEMELRRLTEDGRQNLHEDLDHIFTEGALRFIRQNSAAFGKLDISLK
jgi:hypothetical protein